MHEKSSINESANIQRTAAKRFTLDPKAIKSVVRETGNGPNNIRLYERSFQVGFLRKAVELLAEAIDAGSLDQAQEYVDALESDGILERKEI